MANANITIVDREEQYEAKMNSVVTEALKQWWNTLTKQEILAYLNDQESISADDLRHMLIDQQCAINFGVTFSVVTGEAIADLCTTRD